MLLEMQIGSNDQDAVIIGDDNGDLGTSKSQDLEVWHSGATRDT